MDRKIVEQIKKEIKKRLCVLIETVEAGAGEAADFYTCIEVSTIFYYALKEDKGFNFYTMQDYFSKELYWSECFHEDDKDLYTECILASNCEEELTIVRVKALRELIELINAGKADECISKGIE